MSRRSVALPLAFLFVTIAPVTHALSSVDLEAWGAWTNPASGRYVDRATSLVSEFDATDGVLTPTEEVGHVPAFVCTDAYRSASACAAVSSVPSPCADDPNCTTTCAGFLACAAASAAVVGTTRIDATYTVLTGCAPPRVIPQSNERQILAGSNPVSYLRSWVRLGSACGPGTLVVDLLIDGAPSGRSEIDFP